ncbi:hypothetical protein I316_07783 [Kwoniella heveanensis BCC8398]|uniref:DUF7918 domain-containing protein n=1 Tax=Kwoniella heveanensis BCC8398 TaxID=1296120 RepID=A0A1B9GI13_9TREE|nr:hypothetical protein I316_07783 [Kwoniella heveanensis BCC8398]
MIAKEANSISVYLSVDGEKLEEHRVRKTGDEESRRLECFVIPKPHTEYAINVRLGRQKPWSMDFIAEPSVGGQAVHSLHVKRKWHRNHSMETFFKQDEDGKLMECRFEFGRTVNPQREVDEGSDELDNDTSTIVVAISRAEINKVKPMKKTISQRVRDRQDQTSNSTQGSNSTEGADQKMAFDEEATYEAGDSSENPFLKFVFKLRTHQHLYDRGLIEKKPSQQHPSQVARSVRIKADPDMKFGNTPTTSAQAYQPYSRGSAKREHDVEDIRSESEAIKRCKMQEQRIQQLEDLVRALTEERRGFGATAGLRGNSRRDAISVGPSEPGPSHYGWH